MIMTSLYVALHGIFNKKYGEVLFAVIEFIAAVWCYISISTMVTAHNIYEQTTAMSYVYPALFVEGLGIMYFLKVFYNCLKK